LCTHELSCHQTLAEGTMLPTLEEQTADLPDATSTMFERSIRIKDEYDKKMRKILMDQQRAALDLSKRVS